MFMIIFLTNVISRMSHSTFNTYLPMTYDNITYVGSYIYYLIYVIKF